MAKCIDHVACPECRKLGKDKKGNNLGLYDDSSAYCFSCGYFVRSAIGGIGALPKPIPSSKRGASKIYLPPDLYYPAARGINWLRKYNLDTGHISKYHIQWSNSKNALVFPFYNSKNELIFYQMRFFSGEKKWQSFGPKPLILLGSGSPVVLVEDYISAIRVSEAGVTAVPLFGSSCPTDWLLTIREKYDKLKIWLDYDKTQDKKTKQLYETCKILFKETEKIITTEDPKTYSTEKIKITINSF